MKPQQLDSVALAAGAEAVVTGIPAEPGGLVGHARHAGWVRSIHWVVTLSFLTLVFSGVFILMCHPRLYWGEVGNDLTPALFEFPISINYRHGGWTNSVAFLDGPGSPISASRTFQIFNQNGWARSLHFLAGWFLIVPGLIYILFGVVTGHFRRHLLPRGQDLSGRQIWRDVVDHFRLVVRAPTGGPQYGILQKWSYFGLIFLAFPLVIITGLGMSPAINATFPSLTDMFGGLQSARTVHFFAFVTLMLFLIVHIFMVIKSGFRRQIRAMTFGEPHDPK